MIFALYDDKKESEFFEMARIYAKEQYPKFRIECDLFGYSISKWKNPFIWHHFLKTYKINITVFGTVLTLLNFLFIFTITTITYNISKDAWLSTAAFTTLFYFLTRQLDFLSDISFVDGYSNHRRDTERK